MEDTLSACLDIAKNVDISTIDITGGAPEMNPHLQWFLERAGTLGKRLIVRSNLVILLERLRRIPGYLCQQPDRSGDVFA